MSAARKRRGKKKGGHPVANTSDLKFLPRPEPERKGPKILTLAIMGGAAFFGLKACQDPGDNDNDGDGVYYSTPDECREDGNPADLCTNAWNTAKAEFEKDIPPKLTWDACSTAYGNNCYYDGVTKTWVPMMAGFLLASNRDKKREQEESSSSSYYTSGSGYHYYYTRPVWQNASGDYVWRGGNRSGASASSRSLVTRSATTISRGGFGRSSSSRSSWGG
ncbi:hypothetical protein C3E80_08245 [Cronobacter malonaticus]|uniref:DUF1190 domain-containing protein n=1 Tax=Cronobacter malonaticus TaxID=413503 RepID=A0A423XZQ0_9ENTR|nr:DUF1190 domain-containing protein [Cronobacter malonaticus]ROW62504.1 hypothetical protein C3E80_08245 [Cronobacter malonaticus]RRA41847.1 hypothetical protein C4882_07080 [Cronobacter malonaticus]